VIQGAEACKQSLNSSTPLADIAVVAGYQDPPHDVEIVNMLRRSVQIHQTQMDLCVAMTASILSISSRLTPSLKLAPPPLRALLALGTIFIVQALGYTQCHRPGTRSSMMRKTTARLHSRKRDTERWTRISPPPLVPFKKCEADQTRPHPNN